MNKYVETGVIRLKKNSLHQVSLQKLPGAWKDVSVIKTLGDLVED